MKLYIKEQNSYPDKDVQDWIKRCFERNNIPMNLLNHVVEENRGLYIDTDRLSSQDPVRIPVPALLRSCRDRGRSCRLHRRQKDKKP